MARSCYFSRKLDWWWCQPGSYAGNF
jgi:hypothetical protein